MEDDDTPEMREWSKRFAAKTMRILAIKRGEVSITEYTQEDFDRELKAAMWRCEPDDDFDDTPDEEN